MNMFIVCCLFVLCHSRTEKFVMSNRISNGQTAKEAKWQEKESQYNNNEEKNGNAQTYIDRTWTLVVLIPLQHWDFTLYI